MINNENPNCITGSQPDSVANGVDTSNFLLLVSTPFATESG